MKPATKLVSLSPNVSMILFALAADDVVAGKTAYCMTSIKRYLRHARIDEEAEHDRLARWNAIPEVGTWPKPNVKAVAEIQPDLVLASTAGPFEQFSARTFGLRDDQFRHFPVVTLADLYREIDDVAKLLGKETEGQALRSRLDAEVEEILARRLPSAKRPSILFEYCVCVKFDPDPEKRKANPSRYIMAGGYLAPELITLCGGRPLFVQPGDGVKWIPFDDIRAAQPDVILIFDCHGCSNALKYPVRQRAGWDDLTAVQQGRVYDVSQNICNPNLCFPSKLEELVALSHAYAQSGE